MTGAQLIAAARAHGRIALDERSGKQLLASFGIIVPKSIVVSDARDVARLLAALNPPFAVKVMSRDILHKSDAGGVAINLRNAAEVERALAMMMAAPQIRSARVDGY
ncbi:MAG TPA: acetate--CoA ligase family protein, partial [Burkholderiales bacterium]|nr:acetate--CoA ligase family protein [Burkholderiales bacterium]